MGCLVAIVGPTASGKSRLAVQLAQRLCGEIVNADSRQVYRFMDIGTAKSSFDELRLVPHHLIDVVNPDEPFTLATYQEMAYRAIDGLHGGGKRVFLVGGTGLYVWAVMEGWTIPRVAPSPELRRRLESMACVRGAAAVHQELQAADPAAAAKIAPANLRRVIRALEVYYGTGHPISEQWAKKPPAFTVRIVGLTMPREELYRRIDTRVDRMVADGLVEEVEGLLGKGYNLQLPSMSGIGYRQMVKHLRGEVSLVEAIQEIKFETHRLARHQYAWFRIRDERICWFEAGSGGDMLADEVQKWLADDGR
ncbi:MAG: tRNA (adenosine(37)-N6)-dimethylallyltransferase MiaA [Chloroflexota bacterium]